MPHLSPMNWISSAISFSLILLLLTAYIWWQPQPQFPPTLKKLALPKEASWPWS